MPLPRFRLRTLMIAVAVAGITPAGIVEGVRLRRLSQSYSERARAHRRTERRFRNSAAEYFKAYQEEHKTAEALGQGKLIDDEVVREVFEATLGGAPVANGSWEAFVALNPSLRARLKEAAEHYEDDAREKRATAVTLDEASRYYDELGRKYERAARCPWLAVSPDPPEPSLLEWDPEDSPCDSPGSRHGG